MNIQFQDFHTETTEEGFELTLVDALGHTVLEVAAELTDVWDYVQEEGLNRYVSNVMTGAESVIDEENFDYTDEVLLDYLKARIEAVEFNHQKIAA